MVYFHYLFLFTVYFDHLFFIYGLFIIFFAGIPQEAVVPGAAQHMVK